MPTLEETLMQELRFGGISDENLKQLVGIVAGIQQGGLKRFKVMPKGTPPIVDSVRVSGVLDAEEVSAFLGRILTETPLLSEIRLFPYGIPRPEMFRVHVDVGNPVIVEDGPGF